jgi:hypothetical protein
MVSGTPQGFNGAQCFFHAYARESVMKLNQDLIDLDLVTEDFINDLVFGALDIHLQ